MQSSEVKRIYAKPALRMLSPDQVKKIVLNHAREFLQLIFPVQKLRTTNSPAKPRGGYEAPKLRKLTPEQARMLLIGHASVGDPGAKDILHLLFPEAGGAIPEDN